MKKLISILNVLSFLFISYIIRENFSIDDYYFYDRTKIIESGFKFFTDPLGDIILTYISVVILSTLIFIILLFLRKVKRSFYILSTIVNLVIAIPVLNMYKYALTVNPLGFLEYDRLYDHMLPWKLYISSCILSGVLLAMYSLFNRIKHLFKETTMYRVKKISLVSIGLIFIFYCLSCAYLSFKIKNIADESYATYGEVNKFPDDISDLNFLRMCIRDNYDKDKIDYEEKWCSFPITLIFLNKAKSWYWYEYKSNLYSTRTDLHFPVIVDLELKNFRWVITNVFDHP